MYEEIRNKIFTCSNQLYLNPSIIDEYSSIFFSALGRDFISNIEYKKSSFSAQKKIAHPLLYGLIESKRPETSISELLEIGLYLKSFANDSSISDAVSKLKNPSQFYSTLFHLAMAFRLKMAGASVTLEPQTIKGKADIKFEFQNKIYIAECYRINKTFFDIFGEFESRVLPNFLFERVPKSKTYAFTLKLNSFLTPDGMRKILMKYDSILTNFSNNDEITIIEYRLNDSLLGLQDITGMKPDPDFGIEDSGGVKLLRYVDADNCICACSVSAVNIFEACDLPLSKRTRGNRLFVWRYYANRMTVNPYDTLESKISKKIAQTKTTDPSTRRVIFVEMPFGIQPQSIAHKDIITRATRLFSNLSCICIMERQANSKNRFMYHGEILLGKPEYSIPDSLLDRFNQIETADIFTISA